MLNTQTEQNLSPDQGLQNSLTDSHHHSPWEYGFLLGVIAFAWLIAWACMGSLQNLRTQPLENWFFTDMPYVFAWIKSFGDGGLIHSTLSINQYLNAPYVANWNDFPGEDLAFFLPGQLARVFGLFLGPNLFLMLMQMVCGATFYFVGRSLRYQRCWAMMGAIAFAFAPIIFYRGIGHISVATIWYLPLMIFTLVWINYPEKSSLSEKAAWRICMATSIIAGCFNIYYTVLYTLILGANWLARFIKKDRSSQKIALLLVLILCTEFIYHFNHFLFIWQEGRNHIAMTRDLATLLIASLTLPDLFLSPSHQSSFLDAIFPFAAKYYNNFESNLTTESRTSFIGLTAAIGLLILFAQSTLLIFEKKWAQINHWFWLALGILAFSITGGLNFILGAFGYLLIRSNNRFAVFLMIIGLYFLCELLSKKPSSRSRWIVALAISLFAIWDQVPAQQTSLKYTYGAQTLLDASAHKTFAKSLEDNLASGAMVFQLPAHPFPETGGEENMTDYEQFMPYLFSQGLRFSYGSNKGREDTHWQSALAKLPAKEMLQKLQSYGFSAVLIHKNGYKNKAEELIGQIKRLNYKVIDENAILIAFKLDPAQQPVSPAPEWKIINSSDMQQLKKDDLYQWNMGNQQQELKIKRPWYLSLDPQSPYQTVAPLSLSFQNPKACSIWYQFNEGAVIELKLPANQATTISLMPKVDQTNTLLIKNNCLEAGASDPSGLTLTQIIR